MTVEINLDNNSNVLHYMIILHVSWDHGKQLCCRHVANIADMTGPGTHCLEWGEYVCMTEPILRFSHLQQCREVNQFKFKRSTYRIWNKKFWQIIMSAPPPSDRVGVVGGVVSSEASSDDISVIQSSISADSPVTSSSDTRWDWFFIQGVKLIFLGRTFLDKLDLDLLLSPFGPLKYHKGD